MISTCQAQANSVHTKRESRFHKRISSRSQHAIQSRAGAKSLGDSVLILSEHNNGARRTLLFMRVIINVKGITIVDYVST